MNSEPTSNAPAVRCQNRRIRPNRCNLPAPRRALTSEPLEPATVLGEDRKPAETHCPPRRLVWLDLLVFLALAAIAAAGFYRHAGGDLYSDQADYALASMHGYEANAWAFPIRRSSRIA